MDSEQVVCPLCKASKYKKDTSLKENQDLLICKTCGLYFVQPITLPTNLYNQDYYRAWGMQDGVLPDHVFRLKEETMRRHLRVIKRFHGKGKILEVGSALGSFLHVAQQDGFDVMGVELSKEACSIARSKVGAKNVFNGTLEDVDIEPGSIEVLFMSDVIEHVQEPLLFLQKSFNLLKKGGFVYITTPDPNHWTRFVFGSDWVHYKDEHLMFFSRKAFDWAADRLGFYLFDFSPCHKYANYEYLSAQLKHFDYKALGAVTRLLGRAVPKSFREYLVPISLGETRCILFKPTC